MPTCSADSRFTTAADNRLSIHWRKPNLKPSSPCIGSAQTDVGMASLGVNIDHIANIRQARRTVEPDPVPFAMLAELGGADGITVHLREDRRHIQDRDVELLRQTVRSRLNLEMAATQDMVEIALAVGPDMVTLVPEKREEVTTEGGLDVAAQLTVLTPMVDRLQQKGSSLFVDPETSQLKACAAAAPLVELHTGTYADASWADQPVGWLHPEVPPQLAIWAFG